MSGRFAVRGLRCGFQKPHVVAEVDKLEALGDAPFDFGRVLDWDAAGFAGVGAASAKSLQGGLVIGVAGRDAHGHGQVARPEEADIDAFDAGDGLGVFNALWILII